MSQSKSSKTDKEIMWKKLSTVPIVLTPWQHQALGRGFRKGELSVMATYRQTGKSLMASKMWNLLLETEEERSLRTPVEHHARKIAMIDNVSGHIKDE